LSSNHVARPLSARQLMLVRSAAVLLLLAACLLSGPTRPPFAALLLGLPVGRRMQLGAIGPTKRPIAPSLSALLTKQLDGLASVCLRWPPLNRLRLSCFPNHELGWPRTAIWSDRGSARRKLAPICAHLAPPGRPSPPRPAGICWLAEGARPGRPWSSRCGARNRLCLAANKCGRAMAGGGASPPG